VTDTAAAELARWSPIISAISGFIGVLVGTAIIPWVRDYSSRKRAARYLAIRVVCILDKYLEDCAAVAMDWGREDPEGELETQVSAPSPPSYPSDLDWRSIDYVLMYELLSLPTMAEKAGSVVSAATEHAYGPDYREYFEERNFQYGTLGLKGFALAQRLRKEYTIPDLDFDQWDPVSAIEQQLKELRTMQEARLKPASVLTPPPPDIPKLDSNPP
jgi:hypothetical protein